MFLFISENIQHNKWKYQHLNYSGRQGDSKESIRGKKPGWENYINFYRELKNASLFGKPNPLWDLWLWEQGQRNGALHQQGRSIALHTLACAELNHVVLGPGEFVTVQERKMQTGILPAPDFGMACTDQDLEDFLMHMRKPGRTRSRMLKNRHSWRKGSLK